MTFLAFRPFRRRKHRNDVIVTSYIKILQILKLKSKDITSKTLHAKFYASRIKNKRIRRGGKIRPPQVWSVFKSPGKIGLKGPWFYLLWGGGREGEAPPPKKSFTEKNYSFFK